MTLVSHAFLACSNDHNPRFEQTNVTCSFLLSDVDMEDIQGNRRVAEARGRESVLVNLSFIYFLLHHPEGIN